jgi:sugar phosphate isomerase/epimerase
MKIGVRGHDFGKMQPEALAAKLAGYGLTAVQLAIPKAIIGINDYLSVEEGDLKRIKKAFEGEGIELSVLGCYIEPALEDELERKRQVEIFKKGIWCCAYLGAGVIGTETTRFSGSDDERESAFSRLCLSFDEMVEEAERLGVAVAAEPVAKHSLNSPALAEKLLSRYSGKLSIIFDPVNLLAPVEANTQNLLWSECFERFGDKIRAVHVKDVSLADGALKECKLGDGMMDYSVIALKLKGLGRDIPLLREGVRIGAEKEEFGWMRKAFGVSA